MKSYIKKLYCPKPESHKGENGKLLVIGGSRQYHGAPKFALLAARRFVDLPYYYPGEKDESLINSMRTIPEVIILDSLRQTAEMDCVLFGVGLGGVKFDTDFVIEYARMIVADGDGLKLIKDKIPKGCILTPHEGEFRALFGMPGTKKNVETMAKKNKCIIVKKDPKADIITDGKKTVLNKIHSRGMTKGGSGDCLAGIIASFACKSHPFVAAVAGTYLNGYAGTLLEKKFGYYYCTTDLADSLAEAMKKLRK
jgi:NAD(P)H-hydrate epimerase